jgi:hypothetical protein
LVAHAQSAPVPTTAPVEEAPVAVAAAVGSDDEGDEEDEE